MRARPNFVIGKAPTPPPDTEHSWLYYEDAWHMAPEGFEVRLTPGPGPEPWHGTVGGYCNHACRCYECREANTAAQQQYKITPPKKRDPYNPRAWRTPQRKATE